MSNAFLVIAAFLASAVEMVEALTIVLAVGVTRGWRSTLVGVAAAVIALCLVVAALGPALTTIPIDGLRVGVGFLLLVFGLQWLRKAILRASGHLPLHDEEAIFRSEVAEARQARTDDRVGLDWYAFTLAFKGVFLEGLEVAFIVVTFGSGQDHVALAAIGAAAAILIVGFVGIVVHSPLSRIPENWMKFGVGLLLTTFGVFWSVEGAGIHWPGGDTAIFGLLSFFALLSLGTVGTARRVPRTTMPAVASVEA
jgi:uncharacterized membrane protein